VGAGYAIVGSEYRCIAEHVVVVKREKVRRIIDRPLGAWIELRGTKTRRSLRWAASVGVPTADIVRVAETVIDLQVPLIVVVRTDAGVGIIRIRVVVGLPRLTNIFLWEALHDLQGHGIDHAPRTCPWVGGCVACGRIYNARAYIRSHVVEWNKI